MRLKIFPKTFISAMLLILGVVAVVFALISALTPRVYRAYKEETLYGDLNRLAAALEGRERAEILWELESFAQGCEYGLTLENERGETLFSRLTQIETQYSYAVEEGAPDDGIAVAEGVETQAITGRRVLQSPQEGALTLTLYSSVQPIDEVRVVLLRVLPYALLASIGLSAAVSLVYAKTITAPVKAISKAACEMMRLERDVRCRVRSRDEIGELAENINALYGRLLSAIEDLQREMQHVADADKGKIDFMLAVSHELKTPLTSVKGMLEGMQYRVGVYQDRDEYLARCSRCIDALTGLVNEALDASRLELLVSPQDFAPVNIRKLAADTAAAYEMIALSKQVDIAVDIDASVTAVLPPALFSKALSNVVANAVKYTGRGGDVRVYMLGGRLVVENTCTPLSDAEIRRAFEPFCSGENGGHGLGLYLTKRILKVCGLAFDFVAFDRGMRFFLSIN